MGGGAGVGREQFVSLLVELPPLAESMERGTVRLTHARVLMQELSSLATTLALDVLAAVLPKVDGRTPAQLRGIVRRAIVKVDADAAAKRRREAVRGRRVVVAPEADGIALFGAYLAAGDAMEAYRIVDAHARRSRVTTAAPTSGARMR